MLGSILPVLQRQQRQGRSVQPVHVLAIFNRNFNWQVVKEAARSTSNITALGIDDFVLLFVFALVFDGLRAALGN